MKNTLLFVLIFTLLCIYVPSGAQMVGDNVFLQGHYVEIGIAPNGGYGSTHPAPTGYHPFLGGTVFNFWDPLAGSATRSGNFIGFVADYGRDGWTVGTPPFFGDFYLPGDPQEGWSIQVNGVESDAYIPAYIYSSGPGPSGYAAFPTTSAPTVLTGTNTSYSNSGGIIKGVWNGTQGALAIRQTTILDTNKLYFTVNVVLTNTGSTTLTGIYYQRTVDPDNDETRVSGEYTTINTITYQLPNPTNRVLVSATGVTYTNAYLGLGTKDCRAKCLFINTAGSLPSLVPDFHLDSLYNQHTPYAYTQGTTATNDVGIALEYNIGDLAAGDSTSLTYAYILNASYIDSALDATQPAFYVNDTAYANTDTINLCKYAHDSVVVNIANGGFYHWTWQPDSFLASPALHGPNNVIHNDSITSDIVYTITGTNNAGGCDSIVYTLRLAHEVFPLPTVNPATYCQDATGAVPLTGTGDSVLWYTSATGGVGTVIGPIPSTTVAGIEIFYADEHNGLCHSARAADTVTIIPLPLPPGIADPSPYCQGSAFVPFTTSGSSILWYPSMTGGVGTATAPTINTVIPGTDTVYASQTVAGCEGPRAAFPVTVLDIIKPAFNFAIDYGCHGDSVFFTNQSIGAVQYRWSYGDGTNDTGINPEHIYLTQGTFNVKMIAVNGGGCQDSAFNTVTLIHPLRAAFTADPTIVCQQSPVTFTNASVGTGISYIWSFGTGATDTKMNPSYTYNNVGAYTAQLIVTDFVPCSDTATQLIQVDTISPIHLSVTDSTICKSTYITFTGSYSDIGNTGVTWYFGNGDSLRNVNPAVYAFDGTGQFTVWVRADYRACADISASKTIVVLPSPNVSLGADTSICPGSESIVLTDALNGSLPNTNWQWSTGEKTQSIAIVKPGEYWLKVGIAGCYSSDTILVANDCYMNIPNVFTPNGDGLNDYFYPREYLTKGLIAFKMDIYNRWGQLVFTTSSLDGRGWDGKFNEQQQPEGVYIYIIDGTFKDGQKEHHQGNVTLLR